MLMIIVNILIAFVFGPNITAATNPWGTMAIVSPVSDLTPDIQEYRAVIFSPKDRAFLFEKEADMEQPIASITKLMTALVFLDTKPHWEETYQIKKDDIIEGGRLNLFLGDSVTLSDLFYTSLVASDNGATQALVHASGLSEEEFVLLMNSKAQELGLVHTKFIDPVGLSSGNLSTAKEVARLAFAAFQREEIRKATIRKSYSFVTLEGREKIAESTDNLLFDSKNTGRKILGGKTGYTPQAGYCFVALFADDSGRELISVVLNGIDKNQRFTDSRRLVDWVFDRYIWHKQYSL